MARVILCDSEDGNEAVVLIQDIPNAGVQALCASCFGPWARAVADALAPAPPEMPAPQAEVGPQTAGEGEAAPDPPKSKRRRSGPQAAEETALPEEAPFTDATLVDG